MNFSSKSTTAANVDLMESLLENWLKNNHTTVDITVSVFFFTSFSLTYFSIALILEGAKTSKELDTALLFGSLENVWEIDRQLSCIREVRERVTLSAG